MNKDKAYLQHCIIATEAGNDRSMSGLSLIDGAILGLLTVNEEHAYRMAHHRDCHAVKYAYGIRLAAARLTD